MCLSLVPRLSGLSEPELQRSRNMRRRDVHLQERLEGRELRRDGQGRAAVSAGLFGTRDVRLGGADVPVRADVVRRRLFEGYVRSRETRS